VTFRGKKGAMKQPPHIPGPDPGSLPAEMGHRHPHLAEKENFIQINRQTVPLNKPNQSKLFRHLNTEEVT